MTLPKSLKTLTCKQISSLGTSLHFLSVAELRNICNKLSLPNLGKKLNLIVRIIHFVNTGEIIHEPIIPAVSCAKKGQIDQLSSNSLILKGQYKNDLKTRLFFKNLIGQHFHFTAFGVDWINQRWLQGDPPTYIEYAKMWQSEYQRRREFGSKPKEEWAYINFIQQLTKKNLSITQQEIIKLWHIERQRHKHIVDQIISKHSSKNIHSSL